MIKLWYVGFNRDLCESALSILKDLERPLVTYMPVTSRKRKDYVSENGNQPGGKEKGGRNRNQCVSRTVTLASMSLLVTIKLSGPAGTKAKLKRPCFHLQGCQEMSTLQTLCRRFPRGLGKCIQKDYSVSTQDGVCSTEEEEMHSSEPGHSVFRCYSNSNLES